MTKLEFKAIALDAINKLYRNDPWVRQLYQACGLQLDEVSALLDELLDNGFFDAVTERGLKIWEKDLGITGSGTIAQRRDIVQLLWNQGGTCDLKKIEAIVKTFVLDDVKVKFEEGRLRLEFDNSSFVYALPQIRTNLDAVKPAHIGMGVEDSHITNTKLYAGVYVTSQSVITINPNIGFSTEIEDSQVKAGVYVTKSKVVNEIYV